MLFLERERSGLKRKTAAESEFEFYDRVPGAEWDSVRQMMNEWVGRVPADRQQEVINRLQIRDTVQFQANFWELYLHESFLRMGFTVTWEPQIPRDGQTPLTPDFLIEKENTRAYVEATVLNDLAAEQGPVAARNAVNRIINERLTEHPDIIIAVSFKRQGAEHELPRAAVVRHLEEWLLEFPTDRAVRDLHEGETLPLGETEFKSNQWEIEFRAYSVAEGSAGDRIVGVSLSPIGMRDANRDPHDIRDSIKVKGKKYDQLQYPLVVAMLVSRPGAGFRDLKFALYGGQGLREDVLRTGTLDRSLRGDFDGVWVTKDGPKREWIPAVISAYSHLEPASVESFTPEVWINPWATEDLTRAFAWRHVVAAPEEEALVFEEQPGSKLFENELGHVF